MNKRHISGQLAGARQQGVVLIIGLLLLVVMILLALTASNSAILQEKIAGNFRDASLAFQATEAGARWGASWLQSLGASTGQPRPFPCPSSCTASAPSAVWVTGQYDPTTFDWTSNGWTYGQNPTDASVVPTFDASSVQSFLMVSSPPKFVLEEQFFSRDDLAVSQARGVVYYRVIARGNGQRARTERIINTLLAKRFQ
ncbi:MAG: hypothetical protein BMS9Abin30_0317 [Gammaproteobacteria bacterium]|nr:MAG: hypothetical protein BMS9Abin30_0317 [Gammaproteobacteria bacterium]